LTWRRVVSARAHGLADYGPNFYAPNTMLVPDDVGLWGLGQWFCGRTRLEWLYVFAARVSFSQDGQLRQNPGTAVDKLRGEPMPGGMLRLESERKVLALPKPTRWKLRLRLICNSRQHSSATQKRR